MSLEYQLLVFEFGYYWLVFLAFILGRYFVIAGGTFLWLYLSFGRQRWNQKPFQESTAERAYSWSFVRHDIQLSISSGVVFAVLAALTMMAYKAGYTRIYNNLDLYGWWYLGASFGLTLILQDSYFYFTHRLIHQPWIFRWLHRGHHRSRIPTPWTSFAFELGEALIQGLFFVGLVFLIPLHFVTLIAALLTMTFWAIATHLGRPLISENSRLGLPKQYLRWIGKGLIGPAHHGLHHRYHRFHFGLYFTFWDRLLGTTHPSYKAKPDCCEGK